MPESVNVFFKSFGLQLKYGIVSDFGAKKDMLAELLIFNHSDGEGKLTLDEYVKAMPAEQKYIYYATGESIGKLRVLPQGEAVRERGFDILYLTDEVDEFVMNIIGEYAEKQLKSVNSDDTGLASEEEKEETEKLKALNEELLKFVTETLGGKVASSKLSTKLKSSPVCLSTEGEITLEMEKYFSSVPNSENIKAKRVLELNASHPSFEALINAFSSDREKAAKYAELLYFQALLLADQPLDEPLKYTKLISELMI